MPPRCARTRSALRYSGDGTDDEGEHGRRLWKGSSDSGLRPPPSTGLWLMPTAARRRQDKGWVLVGGTDGAQDEAQGKLKGRIKPRRCVRTGRVSIADGGRR